jgi:hypothetical protein
MERPASQLLASDEPLERWRPDPRHAKAGWGYSEIAPFAFPALLALAFAGVALRSAFPPFLLAFAALVGWILHRGSQGRSCSILVDGVSFELTPQRVRVRMGDARRELRLASIARIEVWPTSRQAAVGHVVVRSRQGPQDERPAIPTGRRVGTGSAGLVFWASLEHVDPTEQLYEGAFTFWYVAHPEDVRWRIEAAVAGVPPHERGPHR